MSSTTTLTESVRTTTDEHYLTRTVHHAGQVIRVRITSPTPPIPPRSGRRSPVRSPPPCPPDSSRPGSPAKPRARPAAAPRTTRSPR